MLNPSKWLARRFLASNPLTLLGAGVGLSLLDFSILYASASSEGVLHIDKGIGLLQNNGLISMLLGNSVVVYLARSYYDVTISLTKSKSITNSRPIEDSLSLMSKMVRMEGKYRFLPYLLMTIGAVFWLSNLEIHVFGNPEERWAHKVFDSPNHILTFFASRLHNLYTWLLVLPLLGHVMIYVSLQLRRIMEIASGTGILRYDLLNPDQKGGFLFIEKAHVIFNVVAAIAYIQISLHIETFAKMNAEHIIAYVAITALLLSINKLFLGDIYSTINAMKVEALNRIKERVYEDDRLSFDILKYCYDRRLNEFSIVNFAIKAGAILGSAFIKLWPTLAKSFKV